MTKLLLNTLASMMLFGGCTNQKDLDMNTTTINGTIYMKGSAPHTYLVIEDNQHNKYQIANPKEFDIIHKQNQTISVQAKIIKQSKSPLIPAQIKILNITSKNL